MSPAKRALDVVAAGLGLVLISPLLALIALAIRFEDGGPAIFRQERVGQGGVPFRMLKLRSMSVDAGSRGGALTVGADPRVTRVGRRLRAAKLDELPQLWNVLKGEMSLVGPRPEVPRYVALYDDAQRRVLDLRPGITDPASIVYRDESTILAAADDPERFYVERVMPDKIRLNLEYAARANVLRDIGVILRTVLPLGQSVRAAAPSRSTSSLK